MVGSYIRTPEIREKSRIANLGKTRSEEQNQKNSQTLKKRWQKPEFRQKMTEAIRLRFKKYGSPLKGRYLSEEHKKKISWLGRKHTDKTRAKMSQSAGGRHKTPEWISNIMKARGIKPNLVEQALINIFVEYNLPFKYVGRGDFILGGKCPDFLNVDGKKQLIELFGIYYHPLFDMAKRIEHFRQYGFSTLIIWEDELGDKKRLVTKVKRFMRRKNVHKL